MTTQSETARCIWQFDPAHTLVEFSGKHMMFTTVKGHFKNVSGTIVLDESNPSRSSVEAEIDASTLSSGVEQRDNHLKSPDFLHIEHHPLITFKSTSVELLESDHAKVIGNLTIRGITREVVLDTQLAAPGTYPLARNQLSFDTPTKLTPSPF